MLLAALIGGPMDDTEEADEQPLGCWGLALALAPGDTPG